MSNPQDCKAEKNPTGLGIVFLLRALAVRAWLYIIMIFITVIENALIVACATLKALF
jgi:hypothetical protein